MDDPLETAAELGTQLGHLVRLAQDPNDPQSLLLGEEIERLSHDEAAALLMVAVAADLDELHAKAQRPRLRAV
jgi:hypothetical protein